MNFIKLAGMKANELRVGNLVYVGYSGTKEPILGIIEESARLMFEGNHYFGLLFNYADPIGNRIIELGSCEPIPLTEEWLINFRLKRKDEEFFYLKEDDHQILIDVNTFDVVLDFREEGYYVTVKHDLKYVHKLQNFYFELNDTELELQ